MERTTGLLPPLVILLGGTLAAWGSYGPWAVCPHDPCDAFGGLWVLVTRYGFDYGTGYATAVVAMALMVVAIAAAWMGGTSAIRRAVVHLALIEFTLVALHLVRFHVFPVFFVYGPHIGLMAVTVGAAISMAGGAMLRPRSSGARKSSTNDDRTATPRVRTTSGP